jgi:hypothetical protein
MGALVFGVVVPAGLIIATIWQPWLFLVGLVYIFTVVFSDNLRRVGRVGGVRCSRQRVVAGGGWSWILRRRWVPPTAIVFASGRSSRDDGDWWHSGTSLRQVQQTLAAEGKSLAGHPSIGSATLGGWIGSHSHGSGGSLWTPTMGRVVVEDSQGTRCERASKKEVCATDLILEVELRSVANVVCERKLAYLQTEHDVRTHLFLPDTHLRAIFVDKYSCLSVTWNRCSQDKRANRGWEFPPLWLLTTLPARMRRDLCVKGWTRLVMLSDANLFGPDPPFFIDTAAISLHTNFEIFVKDQPSTPNLIWRLCDTFRTLLKGKGITGRVEIRFGRNIQFLDFDLIGRGHNVKQVIETVRSIYPPRVRMMLHPGKAQVV